MRFLLICLINLVGMLPVDGLVAGTDTPVSVVVKLKNSPSADKADLTAALPGLKQNLKQRGFVVSATDNASLEINLSSSSVPCPGITETAVRQYKLKLSALDSQTQDPIAETTIIPNCSDRALDEAGASTITLFFTNRAYEQARNDFFDQIRRHFADKPVSIAVAQPSTSNPSVNPSTNQPQTANSRGARTTSETPATAPVSGNVRAARYYALIVAAQNYKDPAIKDLQEPLNDAQKLMNVLTSRYSFSPANVTLLKDPGRESLTAAFEKLLATIGENDNLLIFYAGHGKYDEKLKQGYWLLSDAQLNNRGTWISNADIRDFVGGIGSKHTLLITDACFSGGIFRTRGTEAPSASAGIEEQYKYVSRKALTSGNLKEVPDQSVFMQYLLKRLEQNTSAYLSASQFFYSFQDAVINNSKTGQLPQFGPITDAGDEGGQFIFMLKNGVH